MNEPTQLKKKTLELRLSIVTGQEDSETITLIERTLFNCSLSNSTFQLLIHSIKVTQSENITYDN